MDGDGMSLDRKSWLAGLIARLAAEAMRNGTAEQREPVAYLYNGHQYPPLPEYDKTVYLHAYMINGLRLARYEYGFGLIVASARVYHDAVQKFPDGEYAFYTLSDDNSTWELFHVGTWPWSGWPNFGSASMIWSDTDVLNTDGAVYFAATEPVPLYE